MERPSTSFRPRAALTVAGLCIAALAAAATWLGVFSHSSSETRTGDPELLTALVDAVGTWRPIHPRLTGGFAHGRPPTALRSAAGQVARIPPEVTIAVARIEQASFKSGESVGDRAMLAVARLVAGQTDASIMLLQDVVSEQPDARHLSDLAAAYLTRGRPDDLSAALDVAERAVSADPTLSEALFNRALALTQLRMNAEAGQAWERYLGVDEASAWASEARDQRTELRPAPPALRFAECQDEFLDTAASLGEARIAGCIAAFPREVREFVEVDLPAHWGAAHQARRASAARIYAGRAKQIAALLNSGSREPDDHGDMLTRDIAQAISAASGPKADALAAAHVEYQAAKQAYDRQEFDRAREGMLGAQAQFERADSPAALWVRFHVAVIAYQRSQLARAMELLHGVRVDASTRGYLNLLGRIEWMQSIIDVSNGRLTDAVLAAHRALDYCSRAGNPEAVAALHALQADNVRRLGEPARSWNELTQAFAWLSGTEQTSRRQVIQHVAALTSLQQERLAAASYFFDGYLRAAQDTRSQSAMAEAHVHRARWAFRKGDGPMAARELAAAQARLSESKDRSQADAITGRLLLTEGEILARDNPMRAVQALTEAIGNFERSGRRLFMPRALLARGLAQERLGRVDAATHDYLAGVAQFESQQATVGSDTQRVSYFDDAWQLFDRLVDVALRHQGGANAFAYAERGRARGLRGSASNERAAPAPEDVARRLPPGTCVIYFSTLEDRLVVWTINAGAVQLAEVPVSRERLTTLTTQWRRTFTPSFPPGRRASLARTLGTLLLGRLKLPAGDTLVFVLDGPLHGLPLAALVNPGTGRVLVEDHAIVVSPRVPDTQAPRRAGEFSGVDMRVLAVGNPTVDGFRSGEPLPSLPDAEREAVEVAAKFSRATLQTGSSATRAAFLDAAPHAEIVHFAGHALPNAEYPELSSLVFAPSSQAPPASSARPSASADSDLRAQDIASLRLSHVRLVVLSACGTAAGAAYRGEGSLSLARPFLQAGASRVIATLWPIADDDARALFRVFYDELRAGRGVAEALRRAQLAAMRHDETQAPIWPSVVLYSQ